MVKGIITTAKQIAFLGYNIIKQPHRKLSDKLQGKRVLLCGAGPSFSNPPERTEYDYVLGVNGLSKLYQGSDYFDFFIIEDLGASANYSKHYDSHKMIIASGLPKVGNELSLGFMHKYGYPAFIKKPFGFKKILGAPVFFWGDSVAYFAIELLRFAKPAQVDLVGFDFSNANRRHCSDNYRGKGDIVAPTDFTKQKNSFLIALSRLEKSGVTIRHKNAENNYL